VRYLVDGAYAEAALTRGEVKLVERYPSFVLVDAAAPPLGVPAEALEALRSDRIWVHGREVAIPEGEFELAPGPHTLVRFAGPLSARWRERLNELGIEVLFWAPPHGACVRLPEAVDLDALRTRAPFVVGAQSYVEEQCARPIGAPDAATRRETGALPNVWDLVCFKREQRADVERQLAKLGVEVLASSSSKLRVRFAGDPARLRDLVGVKLVGPARAPKLASSAALAVAIGRTPNDVATAGGAVHGADVAAATEGQGQIVAVADTGLDRGSLDPAHLHPDFAGRVRHFASWPINPSWDSFVDNPRGDDGGADENTGHGTYIAGLVLASGARSNGVHRGVAPGAELVFQALEQRTSVKAEHRAALPGAFYLSGRPLDLRELFRQAREHGARLHVNAWGDPAAGRYTDDCFESDLFLRENPDALIVFAAGNEGGDRDGNRVLDAGSLYAPASAKNVVAIGAVEGPAQGAGWRAAWGDLDAGAQRFRAAADRADAVSGEPDRIALFSCTGPTDDGRIKPDVCAPGTNLVGPRSQATSAKGWGLASPLPHYMYDGGTSAATGVAGGFFAVLRQRWSQARGGAAPSGAALKALAVLGAAPVRSRLDGRPEPRFVAGFGRLQLDASSPARADAQLRLFDELERGLRSGDSWSFEFTLTAEGALSAVLAWYDAPGERLVNDLDLTLLGAQGEVLARGNHAPGSVGAPDRVNTVERIDAPKLAPGAYVLRVVARNVLDGAQPFALAVALDRAALGGAPLQPPGSPATKSLDVPIEWISGIGPATARRLAEAGATQLAALAALDAADFHAATGLAGVTAQKLRARLGVLVSAVATPLPPGAPDTLTLAAVFGANRPTSVERTRWELLQTRLLPLQLVFDKRRWGEIALRRLFA
jgi:serine protease AprX